MSTKNCWFLAYRWAEVRTAKLFNNFLYRNICAMTKERILLTSFLNQVGNKGIYGW
jgi:hypothetical protein